MLSEPMVEVLHVPLGGGLRCGGGGGGRGGGGDGPGGGRGGWHRQGQGCPLPPGRIDAVGTQNSNKKKTQKKRKCKFCEIGKRKNAEEKNMLGFPAP